MDEDEETATQGVADLASVIAPTRPELGRLAQWSVSSHKYGFGVDNLRDDNEGTFWQSEGPQPHSIDLSFPKRVFISSIALLTSHRKDDSYTPSRLSIRAGTGVHDLQEVRYTEFHKPDGWIVIPLRPMDADGAIEGPPIPTHHIRIVIVANHMNGKDTHVRGLKVFGPPEPVAKTTDDEVVEGLPDGPALVDLGQDRSRGFRSQEFRMYDGIR
ncbi:hypothetical protein CcaverHIS002_0502740 [Cutaneotrichosporon cavernicola]|uniref:DOC domain-containing protein n=1 Tax=Cutaneotrichosporon cavernicola TaxID=279322 RepID=A0AA48QWT8_9TREE|nr:uncharacterized protein CcaverHIS019_0503310 [Cutaneotrichosporon cavernicola]BEI84873.1 hypothetical protein CcaverHIS002_0502740 [Cutaneotrichosporon cavernicola]BEI92703.1 hypothetical protein CcaverHIS019_0503310 [Cutaneotrichosporon cavernicola]BEJ08249.1 hypothetical protein CcaverHIS641_0503340 [Cutaneotrichosporon cavernicola]